MKILGRAVVAGLMLPWATGAQAAEAPRSDWQFSTTMYVWVSDLEGNLRTAGPVEPVDVDLSYGKVLKHLKFAGMGALQARKDRLIFLADLSYVHLGADSGIGIRDDDLVEADLDATTFTASLLGGYRVAEGKVDVDLMAGGRLVVTDTDLVLSGPLRTVEGDATESWVDPILAAHVGIPIGAKTTLAIYGDIGGFGVGSDLTWQAVIGVQHRIGSNWQLSAGWRHYAVDYDKGQFLYDVKQSGPIIGARFDF
ncbi:hypothetical protein LZ518_05650 [Sphingomonas sp. RB56-2]|uniref:TIGR04219 family outer membrane beta-barrel protein n=1 Tax=Sphingomonas brevis TaxID=2908206 RepID=A0ABT0S954_9SPHN|nr:hypothetical protein [Sphingomonas brevis]MCL6740616.1 hypothetical protein [Sphingomonas brevis]